MTSKRKGRPHKGELPDLGIYPDDGAGCYEPPADEDTEKLPYRVVLAPGHKAGVVQTFRAGTTEMRSFSVWQDVFVNGAWQHVTRIDSWHGEVHRHDFTRSGGNTRRVLEVIPESNAETVIQVWCDRAEAIIMAEWEDNVRRWHGDA